MNSKANIQQSNVEFLKKYQDIQKSFESTQPSQKRSLNLIQNRTVVKQTNSKESNGIKQKLSQNNIPMKDCEGNANMKISPPILSKQSRKRSSSLFLGNIHSETISILQENSFSSSPKCLKLATERRISPVLGERSYKYDSLGFPLSSVKNTARKCLFSFKNRNISEKTLQKDISLDTNTSLSTILTCTSPKNDCCNKNVSIDQSSNSINESIFKQDKRHKPNLIDLRYDSISLAKNIDLKLKCLQNYSRNCTLNSPSTSLCKPYISSDEQQVTKEVEEIDNGSIEVSQDSNLHRCDSIKSSCSTISVGIDHAEDDADIVEESEDSLSSPARCTTYNIIDASPTHAPENKINVCSKQQTGSENEAVSYEENNIQDEAFEYSCNKITSTEDISEPTTCREWVLKVHKTPQKQNDSNKFAKETPESTSKKVNRNGFAGQLQRALAIWESKNTVRNYKKSSWAKHFERKHAHQHMNTGNDVAARGTGSLYNLCPNYSCHKNISACNIPTVKDCRTYAIYCMQKSSIPVSLSDDNYNKEIKLKIASNELGFNHLPQNAAFSYILMNKADNLVPSHVALKDPAARISSVPVHTEGSTEKSYPEVDITNFPRYLTPCEHLVLIFFLQHSCRARPGEIFTVLPPWQQLLLSEVPNRVLFVSNYRQELS